MSRLGPRRRNAKVGACLVLCAFAGCSPRNEITLFDDGPVRRLPDAGAPVDDAAVDPEPEPCDDDDDCSAPRPRCTEDGDVCVECLEADDCADGESCQLDRFSCVVSCRANADCAGGGRPFCAVASGLCVECAAHTDCPEWEPFCEPRSGRCVDCLTDDACGEQRCDLDDFDCVECLSDDDCRSGETCDRHECRE